MTRRAAAWMLLVLLLLPLLTSCAKKDNIDLPPEAEGRAVITVATWLDYGPSPVEA